ncbi:unnamed protein product [Lactuca saligna]|uniref:Uncharacterized protein n=1 Tax=Lactuca saligna TaxID=75948 RepID=A0AA35V5R2_LACSI|nr:unnamed protein product [Lactuca saligna]
MSGSDTKFVTPRDLDLVIGPVLEFTGEGDTRCPMEGLDVTISTTQKAYEDAKCLNHFKVIVEVGIGHDVTSSMLKEASDWFDKFLKL